MALLNEVIAIEHCKRALDRCEILSKISEMKNGILRQYLTIEHKACNELVGQWMSQAGMDTWQDSVGNQWGRLPSKQPKAKRLILGSHLDTVPNAGAYDGILGVLLAIEIAALLSQNHQELPFHLDIVGFCDEEGTRFATTLIGSKALAGEFNPDWLTITDKEGISMQQAMLDFGLDPKDIQSSALNPEELIAYWEAHIEQGPVLESQDKALGVVTAIAGAKRARIEFRGQYGHAGTTPMHLRHDALTATAELIIAIEQLAKNSKKAEVATVGQAEVISGATNVIPGKVAISLDARAQHDDALEQLIEDIHTKAALIAKQRKVEVNWQWTHQAGAVNCDSQLTSLFQAACLDNNEDAPLLPSGAGHDAMAIAPICPIGMLFIRSPGGISHHPSESVIEEDVTKALKVLYSAVIKQIA